MRIVIDGFFFQLARSGIARLWREMLQTWANLSPDIVIIFLDRGQTDLSLIGVQIYPFPKVPVNTCFEEGSLRAWDEDRAMLSKICRDLNADIFMSTYYTFAEGVTNIMLVCDMIPENNPSIINLDEPIWKMKAKTIYAAAGYVCISYNTAIQLHKHYQISDKNVLVAHCGVEIQQTINQDPSLMALELDDGIPFVLVPGLALPESYKNQHFIFRALRHLISINDLRVVVTGKNAHELIQFYEPYSQSDMVVSRHFSEYELDWCYRNALAVIYPSREEGFGLPIIESLARGALPVTCMNSSLPEAGCSNAVYVDPDNELQLLDLVKYLINAKRNGTVLCDHDRLKRHALNYQWEHMARRVDAFCRQVVLEAEHIQWMTLKGFY